MAYRAGYPEGYGSFAVASSAGGANRRIRWYRNLTDGRIRLGFVSRSKQVGFEDGAWEPVSPIIHVPAGQLPEFESAFYPEIAVTFAAETAASLRSVTSELAWEFTTQS